MAGIPASRSWASRGGMSRRFGINFVSPGYFPILRIPLAQGRIWDEAENHNAAHVAVINQTMARLYFPDGDAIGHSLKVPDMKEEPPYTTDRAGI